MKKQKEELTVIKMFTVYEIKYLEELHNGKVSFFFNKKTPTF